MNGKNYSFDWKGFRFFLLLFALFAVAGVGSHYGFLYASTTYTPAPVVVHVEDPIVHVTLTEALSTTTSVRVINALSIADAVPASGRFIAADLVHMKLYL